jgi:putative membrane protein
MNRRATCFLIAALWAALSLSSGIVQPQVAAALAVPDQTPAVPASSQTSAASGQQLNPKKTGKDRKFAKTALEDGLAQIEFGQLAVQKGDSPDIKQFGQKMIADHSKMNDQIKPIAQQLGVDIPAQLSKDDRKTLAKLSVLSGTAFDQAYIKNMVKDHHAELFTFQEEAASGQDPVAKDAALHASKIINDHLQSAQQIAMNEKIDVTGL